MANEASTTKGGDESKYQTQGDIVQFWLDVLQDELALSPGEKKLQPKVVDEYRGKLEDFVKAHIGKGHKFTKKDQDNTERVARDLARICKIVTTKSDTITLETFEPAFYLVQKHHDVCSGPFVAGGTPRGAWCGGGA